MRQKPGRVFVVVKQRNFFITLIKILAILAVFFMCFYLFKDTNRNNEFSLYETTAINYNKYYKNKVLSSTGQTKGVDSSKVVDNVIFNPEGNKVFLFDFKPNKSGSEFELLQRNIDFVILNAKKGEEAVIRLYSPGGSVTAYGLGSSLIERLRTHGIKTTVIVDEVAASGGYMMAVVADKIVAAPFSFVGSIGVVSETPIYQDLLNKFGVEYKVYTAGKDKRNVVSTIKPSSEDEAKLKESLNKIHQQFKDHVAFYRPNIDVEKTTTGAVFSGKEALDLKLVDEISTSSEYLLDLYRKNYSIIYVQTEKEDTSELTGSSSLNSFLDNFMSQLIDKFKSEIYNSDYKNIKT